MEEASLDDEASWDRSEWVAGLPHDQRTTTLITELRLTVIDAPMLIDGAINGAGFLADVQQVLFRGCAPAAS